MLLYLVYTVSISSTVLLPERVLVQKILHSPAFHSDPLTFPVKYVFGLLVPSSKHSA